MYLLGFDIGSSSIKVSLLDAENGKCLASSFQPAQEMEITAKKPGWAEQEPEDWWKYLKLALAEVLHQAGVNKNDIKSIGISYQMHGLVLTDKDQRVLRPSIIWCDSRAVETGKKAFQSIGENRCLASLLNSPGNFTASKLAWVKENEPEIFEKTHKIMLPGDYIAMKLTGNIKTTISGLSEGIMWDFKKGSISEDITGHYGFSKDLIPDIVPVFSIQGELPANVAKELELAPGILVSYRAGDQPNNAFSLNVVNPGEIAATAGTSGVIYGVSDEVKYDPRSRINSFAHVNHSNEHTRIGVLLCVNGTGILNSWLKRNLGETIEYPEMNKLASSVPVGSQGLITLPFGNGAERMLGNMDPGASLHNLNFNLHNKAHLLRSAQEGIVFALHYGMEIMKNIAIQPSVIRAGNANMFLSPVFRDTLAGITGAGIELYDTDGAKGAALGSGVGAGIYKDIAEALGNLKMIKTIVPDKNKKQEYISAYAEWHEKLKNIMG